MSDAVEFATVTPEEWEKIPPPVPPKPKDRFEQLLVSVGEGNIVKVNAKEEKDIKGMRIAIARKARNLGFIAEFRNLGTVLYVKRSDKPLEEKEKPPATENKEERATRKKKTEAS